MSYGIPQSFATVLENASAHFTTLAGEEWCCGFPLFMAGQLKQAEELARHNVKQIQALGVPRVVTTCPSCYHMWHHLYPEILGKELEIEAAFICSDIYKLPDVLDEKFDIVYTSGGVLCWLPDLKQWAEIITHFLKPGGFFYILEGHPFRCIFDDSPDATELKVKYSYFHTPEPVNWEPEGDYADPDAVVTHGSYEWTHDMGDIINSLISSGLRVEYLHEFPTIFYKCYPFMKKDNDGLWRVEGDRIPLTFTLKATKPTGN